MRELLAAALALTALGAFVFAPHVAEGGWYSDDWASAATYRFAPEPRYRNAARVQRAILGARPVLAHAQPLPHAVFGERPALHVALAVALAVAVSIAFFALLRVLGLPFLPALAIAGLALVFPWADSTRLWPIGGLNQLALLLWLGGALVALRGLRSGGPGGAAWHAGALALYALALLTYEAVGGLVIATGALYVLTRRGPARRALARWGTDAVLAVALLVWARHESGQVRQLSSTDQVLDDVPTFARQSLELAGQTLVPVRGAALVALVLAAAVGALLVLRGRLGEPAVRRWAGVAAVAALGTVAALAPFAGSGLHPLDEGLNNRGNMAAALPLAALAYAVLALAGVALARQRALALTAGAALVLGGAYAYQVRGDVVRWDRAATAQERILSRLERAIADPARGTVVYAYGQPLVVSPGVSIFSQPWDLSSAVRLRYDDASLNAYPLAQGVRIRCERGRLYPQAAPGPWGTLQDGYGPRNAAPYGRALLFDAATGALTVPRDARACEAAAAGLTPAPFAGDPR